MVGSDDGTTFWSLTGLVKSEMTHALEINFGPKGGPVNLNGTYSHGGGIQWQDGNSWGGRSSLCVVSHASLPPAQLDFLVVLDRVAVMVCRKLSDFVDGEDGGELSGLYVDPALHTPGTMKGVRMISDRNGADFPLGKLTIVGSVRLYLFCLSESGKQHLPAVFSTALGCVSQDDGVNFWTLSGTNAPKSGTTTQITVDFSQAGGTGSTERLAP